MKIMRSFDFSWTIFGFFIFIWALIDLTQGIITINPIVPDNYDIYVISICRILIGIWGIIFAYWIVNSDKLTAVKSVYIKKEETP